jgi:hypothetical protein
VRVINIISGDKLLVFVKRKVILFVINGYRSVGGKGKTLRGFNEE